MAYWRVEPWGEQRADWRAGLICSTLCNINARKGSKPLTPEDFMPGAKRDMTGAEIVAALRGVLKTVNKKGPTDGADR